jgi:hypothetical protein
MLNDILSAIQIISIPILGHIDWKIDKNSVSQRGIELNDRSGSPYEWRAFVLEMKMLGKQYKSTNATSRRNSYLYAYALPDSGREAEACSEKALAR